MILVVRFMYSCRGSNKKHPHERTTKVETKRLVYSLGFRIMGVLQDNWLGLTQQIRTAGFCSYVCKTRLPLEPIKTYNFQHVSDPKPQTLSVLACMRIRTQQKIKQNRASPFATVHRKVSIGPRV